MKFNIYSALKVFLLFPLSIYRRLRALFWGDDISTLNRGFSLVTNSGERYLPLAKPYNAAMHLGHMASYKEALRYSYGLRILDIGCGVGYGAFFLASYGTKQVVAIDFDPHALAYARKEYHHPNLQYSQVNAFHLPFPDVYFDFVFSAQVIEHVPSPEQFLNEIKRVLSPTGFCLIATPNKRLFSPIGTPDNPHHISEMDWKSFKRITEAVFPQTQFCGIPQHCLKYHKDQPVPTVKRNSEIQPQDYRIQYDNLEECENMLCIGYMAPDRELFINLPNQFQPVTDELAPFFWDASTSKWSVMGIYPDDIHATALTLYKSQHMKQSFISPDTGLYRIEIDVITTTKTSIKATLCAGTDNKAKTIVQARLQQYNKKIVLSFPAQTDSENQLYTLTIGLDSGLWSLLHHIIPFKFQSCITQKGNSHCSIDRASQNVQLAMRTFHQSLPEHPAWNHADSCGNI